MAEISKCGSCGASILFIRSATTGNYMPVDAEPVQGGNIAVIDGQAHVLKGDLLDAMLPAGPRYKSHFATCANGPAHRKGATDGKAKAKAAATDEQRSVGGD